MILPRLTGALLLVPGLAFSAIPLHREGLRPGPIAVEAAEEAGMALKNKFPMLQVQVYDAATKTRSMVQWPVPA